MRAEINLSDNYLYLRFDRMPRAVFDYNLGYIRQQFPSMSWDTKKKMWRLPSHMLKPVYESCRFLIGVQNVSVTFDNYSSDVSFVQLPLSSTTEE